MIGFLLVIALSTAGVKAAAGAKSAVTAEPAVPSWASAVEGVWYLEEGTSTTRVSSGSCTTACGLTAGGNTTNSTTQVQQGTYSNTFDGTDDDLSCTNANCGTALGPVSSGGSGGSVTYGCWIYNRGWLNAVDVRVIDRHDTNAGYYLGLPLLTGPSCGVDSVGVSVNSYVTNTWFHAVCVFDDAGNTLTPLVNGKAGSSPASPTSISSVAVPFTLGNDGGTTDFYGYLDECFVWKGAMSDAEVCRVCSCGIDGSLCSYNSTTDTYGNKGRNASHCQSCTLSSPSATAP